MNGKPLAQFRGHPARVQKTSIGIDLIGQTMGSDTIISGSRTIHKAIQRVRKKEIVMIHKGNELSAPVRLIKPEISRGCRPTVINFKWFYARIFRSASLNNIPGAIA
ncbi:MAG TPA: hypothetical protein VMG59_08270 [Phycisphaerae bacterium]|nr:hypothetical protein [Phycisphaerae bacterium]